MADNIQIDLQTTVQNIDVNVTPVSGASTVIDYFYPQGPAGPSLWGVITGALSSQTDLWAHLSAGSFNSAQLTAFLATNPILLSSLNVTPGRLLSAGTDLFDIFLTHETDSQTLSYVPSSYALSITNGNTVVLSSERYENAYTAVNAGSANWYAASGAAVNAAGSYVASNYLPLSGGVVYGDLQVKNLTVYGGVTSVSAAELSITDPLIYIANDNHTDLFDIGIVGAFQPGTSATYQHTGLVRLATPYSYWALFDSLTAEPLSGSIPKTDPSFRYADLHVGGLYADYGATNTTKPVLTLGQNWNSVGTNFTLISANAIDTNSGSSSLLMDLQVGGASRFKFSKSGAFTISDGSTYTFALIPGSTSLEVRLSPGGNTAGLVASTFETRATTSTNRLLGLDNNTAYFISTGAIQWNNNTTNCFSAGDLFLYRDAAGTLAQRNGINPQTFRLYNTYTNATNYQRGTFTLQNSALVVGTEYATTAGNAALSGQSMPLVLAPGYNQSLSATSPVVLQQTWNNSANAFTLLSANVTDTASNASSLLMDLQVGGNTRLQINKNGQFKVSDSDTSNRNASIIIQATDRGVTLRPDAIGGDGGGLTGPSFYTAVDSAKNSPVLRSINSNATVQYFALYSDTTPNTLALRNGINSQEFRLYNTYTSGTPVSSEYLSLKANTGSSFVIGPSATGSGGFRDLAFQAGGSTRMTVTSAGSVGIGTTAPTAELTITNPTSSAAFHLYNKYDSATSYERGFMKWNSNVLQLGTEKGSGGGTARALEFQMDGATRLTIDTSGHTVLTLGRRLYLGSGTAFIYETDSQHIIGSGSGSWNRLCFGGNTSAFPALKRSTTTLQARLADDSDFTDFYAKNLVATNSLSATGYVAASSLSISNGGTILGSGLALDQNGTLVFQSRGGLKSNWTNGRGAVQLTGAGDNLACLQFGGTSSSLPAILQRGNGLQVRLADDSAYTTLSASTFVAVSSITTPSLNITGDLSAVNITASGDITANRIQATVKNFSIPHPSKPGKKLVYSSVESPYNGVQLTGEGKVVNGKGIVKLPDYLQDLVHDCDVHVQLTNYKHSKALYVDSIEIAANRFTVKCDAWMAMFKTLKFFWTLNAVRKDVERLKVEV